MSSGALKWLRLGRPARAQASHALAWLLVARVALRLLSYNTVRRLVQHVPSTRRRRGLMTPVECEAALLRCALGCDITFSTFSYNGIAKDHPTMVPQAMSRVECAAAGYSLQDLEKIHRFYF